MLDLTPKKKPVDCLQVYRYRESVYMKGGSLVYEHSWTHMKKLSCRDPHCHSTRCCYGPKEDADEVGVPEVHIECRNPQHGKLYYAVFIPDSGPDYWTGNIEEWHWEMIPYEEKK